MLIKSVFRDKYSYGECVYVASNEYETDKSIDDMAEKMEFEMGYRLKNTLLTRKKGRTNTRYFPN